MPFSYAQYAGNGSTATFSVPFPYLLKAHVKLYTGFNILSGAYTTLLVDGTDYTWTSTTQVQTTVAPANGVTLTILRDTPDGAQLVPWQDGSNLTADDFNNADLQNLYVVQEQQDRNDAGAAAAVAAQTAANSATAAATAATTAATTATTTAAAATAAATAATTAANASTAASTQATADSQTALTQSAAAVNTANTAAANAATAVSTANSASTTAAGAVSTANTASTAATNAATTAAGAVTTANASNATAATALTNSQTAISTANAATTTAGQAVTTAGQAVTTANGAASTANAASASAAAAASTANSADSKADQAINAVANAILYDLVANVAAIPASPANNDAVEVFNSTGIESFTPLSGKPAGFAGSSGLSVRMVYTTTGNTWTWIQYFPNDPETRYLKFSGGTLTGQLLGDDSNSASTPGYAFDGDPDTGIGRPGANELALITGGVARLTFDSAGAASFTNSVTIPAGSTVAGYLDTATAASTYQSQAGMSSYLTTAAAASTYQTQAGMSTYAPVSSPAFTGQPYVNGSYRGNVTAVAALEIDCSLGNYFTKTINGASTFTVSNVPASRSYSFTLELTHTSGAVTWFGGVEWPAGTAPTLTTGKTHLFVFVTDDGGTRWRGAALVDYAN